MEISELREMIDKADTMILTSFVTRMRVVAEIAEYKKKNSLPVLDSSREDEKLKRIAEMAPDDLEAECLSLYNNILMISRDFQEKAINGKTGKEEE